MQTTVPDVLAELEADHAAAVRQRELAEYRLREAKKERAPRGVVDELERVFSAATRKEEQVRAAMDQERKQRAEDDGLLQSAPVRSKEIAEEDDALTGEIADHVGAILLACKQKQKVQAQYDDLQGKYLAAQRRRRPGEKERCLPGSPSGIVSRNASGRDCLNHVVRLTGSPLLRSEKFSPDRLTGMLQS